MNGRKLWVQRLLPITVLAWAYLLLRLLNIGGWNAYFIDEVFHMDRARIVLEFSNLQVSTTPGKFLLYYYLSIFQLPAHEPVWLARTAVALFSVIGLGAAYALGRQLFSHRAGLLAVVLLAVFPMMSFHERHVLSDPLAATTITIVLWWSIVVAKRPTRKRATMLAVVVSLMIASKLIAVPLVAAPFLAVGLFAPNTIQFRQKLWPQLRGLWVSYWPYIKHTARLLLIVWVPILVLYQIRFTFFPETTAPLVVDTIYAGLVNEYNRTTWDTVKANIDHLAEMFGIFWGLLLIVPTVFGTIYAVLRRPRAALFLLASIMLIWLPLFVIAAFPSSRYYMVMGPTWMVLVAGGVVALVDDLRRSTFGRLVAAIPVVSLVGWIALYALPYNLQMADNLLELELPQKEKDGYFRRYTSYGLRDGLAYILERPPLEADQDVPVVMVVNAFCRSTSYLFPEGTPIEYYCPESHIKRQLTRAASISIDLKELTAAKGAVYIIHDELSLMDINEVEVEGYRVEPIETYQRPFDGRFVYLYRVVPDGSIVGASNGED